MADERMERAVLPFYEERWCDDWFAPNQGVAHAMFPVSFSRVLMAVSRSNVPDSPGALQQCEPSNFDPTNMICDRARDRRDGRLLLRHLPADLSTGVATNRRGLFGLAG